jgi:pimeloyl-ACP methyl ester carboxylesterase
MSGADGGLHVDVYGSGPAVVLLHGTPSSPDDFAPLIGRLAGRRKILVPHLPGYGRTRSVPHPYELERVIADLEDRLAREGVFRAALVAFSGGAYKALWLALRGRIAVPRMVLVAPVIGFDADVAQGYRDLAAAARVGAFDPRPSWLERMASPGFFARDPEGAARVLAWLDAAPRAVIYDELVALADAPDLRPRLAELECPILVCAGQDDQAVPIASSEEVARLAKHGTFRGLAGAGHAILIERPPEALRLVEDFLGDSDLDGV